MPKVSISLKELTDNLQYYIKEVPPSSNLLPAALRAKWQKTIADYAVSSSNKTPSSISENAQARPAIILPILLRDYLNQAIDFLELTKIDRTALAEHIEIEIEIDATEPIDFYTFETCKNPLVISCGHILDSDALFNSALTKCPCCRELIDKTNAQELSETFLKLLKLADLQNQLLSSINTLDALLQVLTRCNEEIQIFHKKGHKFSNSLLLFPNSALSYSSMLGLQKNTQELVFLLKHSIDNLKSFNIKTIIFNSSLEISEKNSQFFTSIDSQVRDYQERVNFMQTSSQEGKKYIDTLLFRKEQEATSDIGIWLRKLNRMLQVLRTYNEAIQVSEEKRATLSNSLFLYSDSFKHASFLLLGSNLQKDTQALISSIERSINDLTSFDFKKILNSSLEISEKDSQFFTSIDSQVRDYQKRTNLMQDNLKKNQKKIDDIFFEMEQENIRKKSLWIDELDKQLQIAKEYDKEIEVCYHERDALFHTTAFLSANHQLNIPLDLTLQTQAQNLISDIEHSINTLKSLNINTLFDASLVTKKMFFSINSTVNDYHRRVALIQANLKAEQNKTIFEMEKENTTKINILIDELDKPLQLAKEYDADIQVFYNKKNTLFNKTASLPADRRTNISLDISLDLTLQTQAQNLISAIEYSIDSLKSLTIDSSFAARVYTQISDYHRQLELIHNNLEIAENEINTIVFEMEKETTKKTSILIDELSGLIQITKEYHKDIRLFYDKRKALFNKIASVPADQRINMSLDLTLQTQAQDLMLALENSLDILLESFNIKNVFDASFLTKENISSIEAQVSDYHRQLELIHNNLETAENEINETIFEVKKQASRKIALLTTELDELLQIAKAYNDEIQVFYEERSALFDKIAFLAASYHVHLPLDLTLQTQAQNLISDISNTIDTLKSLNIKNVFDSSFVTKEWLSLIDSKINFYHTRIDLIQTNLEKAQEEIDEIAFELDQKITEQKELQKKIHGFDAIAQTVKQELNQNINNLQRARMTLTTLRPKEGQHIEEAHALKLEIKKIIGEAESFITTNASAYTKTISLSKTMSDFNNSFAMFDEENSNYCILMFDIHRRINVLQRKISEAEKLTVQLKVKIDEILADAETDKKNLINLLNDNKRRLKAIEPDESEHKQLKTELEKQCHEIESKIAVIETVVMPNYQSEMSHLITIDGINRLIEESGSEKRETNMSPSSKLRLATAKINEFAEGFDETIKRHFTEKLRGFNYQVLEFEETVQFSKKEKAQATKETSMMMEEEAVQSRKKLLSAFFVNHNSNINKKASSVSETKAPNDQKTPELK